MARRPRKGKNTRRKVVATVLPSTPVSTVKKKSGFTIYIDDDDTPPPPETGLGASSRDPISLASPSDYGGSSDNDDMIAAVEQMELMRSWVDCGIQMAIKETEAGILAGGGRSEMEKFA